MRHSRTPERDAKKHVDQNGSRETIVSLSKGVRF